MESLLFYGSNRSDTIRLIPCQLPEVLDGFLPGGSVVRRLSRLPSNNIMVIIYTVLELALTKEEGQPLLDKIKEYAYDEDFLIIDILEVSERGKHSEMVLKRLFVEFFHVCLCSKQKNKVQKVI